MKGFTPSKYARGSNITEYVTVHPLLKLYLNYCVVCSKLVLVMLLK